LLVVDECHAQRKQTIEFIKNNPHIKVVGLSASPFTKGLSGTYTNVVSPITTKKLVEQGSLVPLRVFIAKEVDMEGAKKVAGEWTQADASERGMKITGDVVTEWAKKTREIFGEPRKTIVLAGCEAHICLMQTALDLLEDEFEVWVVTDACSSRTERNRDAAYDRLAGAGAELVTAEMVAFEWLRTAEHPDFKLLQSLFK
jgi:hypothetical protein